MISREREAEILRLYHAEQWPIGTIATHVGVHHSVVRRLLEHEGLPRLRRPRSSKLDQYVAFVDDVLRQYPRLCASRLFWMCRERGYDGSEVHLRRLVARRRPRPPAEAFLRLRTLPGEQGQVDWGHFGTVRIRRAERPLVAFVIVLSYSRRIFLRFFLGMQTENFLRGHAAAFCKWGGCPRVVLYDNLKSAVLERKGDSSRFNPLLLDFSGHYHFQIRPVAVARGNEKGRVERAIQYVRRAFFAARRWQDIDDLNAQAEQWCDGQAFERPWPEDRARRVADAFADEQGKLLVLPATEFPLEERREVAVGKTPYVRFDGNDYSVPHEHVRRTLIVLATPQTVRVVAGQNVVAEHGRSFGRREQIEDPRHVEQLVASKRAAHTSRGFDRLYHAAPSSEQLMGALAARGGNLGAATSYLLRLLAETGPNALEAAIRATLERGVCEPSAVRHMVDQQLRAVRATPAIPVGLPADPRVTNLAVRPHPLGGYDEIAALQAPEGGGDDQ